MPGKFTFLACSLGILASFSICIETVPAVAQKAVCRKVILEGQVNAGQGFDRPFTKTLRFVLDPLRSGWIVRVLPATPARGAHDFAELATPPYQSVSPLLISTDWAFRAQDAVAWNPRHFRYAADQPAFRALEHLQPAVLASDPESTGKISALIEAQPEGSIELLDARFAPGVADQASTASGLALHLASTPHVADSNAAPSPLGQLESLRFRVSLDLASGQQAIAGIQERVTPCAPKPTVGVPWASHPHTAR